MSDPARPAAGRDGESGKYPDPGAGPVPVSRGDAGPALCFENNSRERTMIPRVSMRLPQGLLIAYLVVSLAALVLLLNIGRAMRRAA